MTAIELFTEILSFYRFLTLLNPYYSKLTSLEIC